MGQTKKAHEVNVPIPMVQDPQPTYGEKLAGTSINPSNDINVDRVKNAAAFFMDTIHSVSSGSNLEMPVMQQLLFEQAKIRALEAQMLAVKAVTWKH